MPKQIKPVEIIPSKIKVPQEFIFEGKVVKSGNAGAISFSGKYVARRFM